MLRTIVHLDLEIDGAGLNRLKNEMYKWNGIYVESTPGQVGTELITYDITQLYFGIYSSVGLLYSPSIKNCYVQENHKKKDESQKKKTKKKPGDKYQGWKSYMVFMER